MTHKILAMTLAVMVTFALLIVVGPACADEKIAENENLVCTTCHDKPGSKLLTDQGKYYELMGSMEGFKEVKASFENCTSCHVRKPGSKKLTRKGKMFFVVVGDMEGLREWVQGEHPGWLELLAEEAPADQKLWEQAALYFKPLPETAPNPENPTTAVKVALGEKLYFDTRLSEGGNQSCNSCHNLATFGVDNLPTSPGDKGEFGTRNSPTVLNAALHATQFWDGRAKDVEEQAGMPITNPVEMAIPSEAFLVERLGRDPLYPELFVAAFPGDEPALEYKNVARALAAFERTLLTPARFDDYLQGDHDALNGREKDGLQVFFDLGCASCHNGVNLGAHTFRKFGLGEKYWEHTKSRGVDEGRYVVTGDEEDKYVFKVSSLRNIAKTGPYFHDGSVATLDEAVRVMTRLQVGVELEDAQVESMVAFLETLTGEVPENVRGAEGFSGGPNCPHRRGGGGCPNCPRHGAAGAADCPMHGDGPGPRHRARHGMGQTGGAR